MKWFPIRQILRFLLNEALVSSKCLNGVLVYRVPDEVKLSASSYFLAKIVRKPFGYLEDSSVLKVISKNSSSPRSLSPRHSQSEKKLKITTNDDLFDKELKMFINKLEPLQDSCKKYFKNFFCDHDLSPDLRRWLWRERIGNPIRMNRTIFTTWANRTSALGICLEQEAVIKADLIRACTCLEDNEDKAKIYSDLEKLISIFVVIYVDEGYRPDIGYVQGMSAVMLQLYKVAQGEWFETFALFCNLILANRFCFTLYQFDHESVVYPSSRSFNTKV